LLLPYPSGALIGRQHYDLCVVEHTSDDPGSAADIYTAVAPSMRNSGKVVLYWINQALAPLGAWDKDMLTIALLRGPRIVFRYSGSTTTASAMRLVRWARRLNGSNPFSWVVQAVAFPCAVLMSLGASIRGLRIVDSPVPLGSSCLSATAEIYGAASEAEISSCAAASPLLTQRAVKV
jgi:hypothetical protein